MNYDCFYFLLHLRYIDDNRNTQKQKKRITIKCQHMTFFDIEINIIHVFHTIINFNQIRNVINFSTVLLLLWG